jgi:cytochrome c-type biogenesis protein CcsB
VEWGRLAAMVAPSPGGKGAFHENLRRKVLEVHGRCSDEEFRRGSLARLPCSDPNRPPFFILFNPMMALDFEPFFQNLSFASLLFLLLFQWAQASWLLPSQSEQNEQSETIGFVGMGVANAALTLLLLIRWVMAGHFPLSNLYESLLFLSWSFTAFHLVLHHTSNLAFLGLITTPMALFTNAFATFSLPPEMQRATGLVPALQSNWLMMHVTIMIVSYAALMSGCLLSMAFLIVQYGESRGRRKNEMSLQDGSEAGASPTSSFLPLPASGSLLSPLLPSSPLSFPLPPSPLRKEEGDTTPLPSAREAVSGNRDLGSPLASRLDNLSYRTLGLGFPLLTIGILSGAVWANEAWGSYWSWDPKETWALITWLVFAIYLHTRITKDWSGTKPAVIATMGFFVLWICYLGVNLLGTGLHSYGWFQR